MAGYGDDAGFTVWATAAGYTVPAGTVAAARQRGSLFIDGNYGARFPGTPTGGLEQEREWPRTGASDRYGNAIDAATIPTRVINASYEAALRELQSPGSLAPDITPGKVKKRVKVEGAVEVEYAVGQGTAAEQQPVITVIDGLLAPLLTQAMPVILVV
jgi:hypothetical protein